MTSKLSEPFTVWLMGNTKDVIAKTFEQHATEAGHAVYFLDRSSVEAGANILPDAPAPDILIDLHTGVIESSELKTLFKKINPAKDTLILASVIANATSPLVWSFEEYSAQTVGYSALGFYLGKPDKQPVLELVANPKTRPEMVEAARKFLDGIGIQAIEVKDTCGVIFPRIIAMIMNEAVSALMEGVASPEDIDTAMKLGTNYPEGPLRWADKMGLDTVYGILTDLSAEYRDERYRPMPLLKQMVFDGKLGEKTGEGFYKYQVEVAL